MHTGLHLEGLCVFAGLWVLDSCSKRANLCLTHARRARKIILPCTTAAVVRCPLQLGSDPSLSSHCFARDAWQFLREREEFLTPNRLSISRHTHCRIAANRTATSTWYIQQLHSPQRWPGRERPCCRSQHKQWREMLYNLLTGSAHNLRQHSLDLGDPGAELTVNLLGLYTSWCDSPQLR